MQPIYFALAVSLLTTACIAEEDDDDVPPDDFSNLGDGKSDAFTGQIQRLGRYGDAPLDMGDGDRQQSFRGLKAGGKRYLGVPMKLAAGVHDFQVENELGTGVKAFVLDKTMMAVALNDSTKASVRMQTTVTAAHAGETYWLVVREPKDGPGDFTVAHGGDVGGVHTPVAPDCTLEISPTTARVGADLTFTLTTIGETKECSSTAPDPQGLPAGVACNTTWKAKATLSGTAIDYVGKVVGPGGGGAKVVVGGCKARVKVTP